MRLVLALILAVGGLHAQAVTVGAIAAVPVTDTFDTGFIYRGTFTPETVRYHVGPAVDFRLAGPFRVEINALYQPFSFTHSDSFGPSQGRQSGNLWQFPAVLKFRIPTPLLKPFIEAGPSIQIATNITDTTTSYRYMPPQTFVTHPDPYPSRAVPGIVVGGGIDIRLGHFLISPQVRYTRWISGNFDFSQEPSSYVGSHLNQIQVLLSIRASVHKAESR